MKLSNNFSLKEFTASETAEKHGLKNEMEPNHLNNAIALAKNVLQPVRDEFGPTIITSGYRSPEVNKKVGGVPTSQHANGEAADIEVPGLDNEELAYWIKENIDFDQIILEFYTEGQSASGWVHVSYKRDGNNRGNALRAYKDNEGNTQYEELV